VRRIREQRGELERAGGDGKNGAAGARRERPRWRRLRQTAQVQGKRP